MVTEIELFEFIHSRWAKSRYTVYSIVLQSFTIPVKKKIITVYLILAHPVQKNCEW